MKKNFEECMARLLEHEGGYVWHAQDPGGETNFGVTRAVYEQYVGRQVMDGEMEGLTHDDVYPIYKENYWDAVRGDDLPSGVDWSCFDWAVNSGKSRASKALQRIVGVEADGGIGPMTLRAVAEVEQEQEQGAGAEAGAQEQQQEQETGAEAKRSRRAAAAAEAEAEFASA